MTDKNDAHFVAEFPQCDHVDVNIKWREIRNDR